MSYMCPPSPPYCNYLARACTHPSPVPPLQMLSEMDGFDAESGVIVMAATNRKDVLDPALVRPGRFDRIIYIGRPDFNGRIEILEVRLLQGLGFFRPKLEA